MSLQDELRQSGFNGCIAAADELDRLSAELAAAKAELASVLDEEDRLNGKNYDHLMMNSWKPTTAKDAEAMNNFWARQREIEKGKP